MVLVDTSVWIEVFRRPAGVRLEDHVDFDEVVTCLPVVREVLQGFDREADFRLARDAMWALPIVESPLPGPHGLSVLHVDRDFANLAKISTLAERSIKRVRRRHSGATRA